MNKFGLLIAIVIAVSAPQVVNADEIPPPRDCPHCTPPTQDVCFNLVCHYDFDGDHGREHQCSVATTFTKAVTRDGGGEVQDASNAMNNPKLQVTCDGLPIYNDGSRRFTDMLGTRIQGITGPDPAVLLPRGALHAADGGEGGGHYSPSVLELDHWGEFKRAKGSCFIWTGFPKN